VICIRAQQLEMFVTQRADAFVNNLIAQAPSAWAGDDARAVVLGGIEAAIGFGFLTPDGIRGFVRRLFVLGSAYYEHAAVRDWIGEFGLSEEARLAVVDAHADEIRAANAVTPPQDTLPVLN